MQRSFAPEINAILQRMEVPLSVVDTPDKGKHVVALKELPKGTELFEEIPMVSWTMDSFQDLSIPQCWWCLRVIKDGEDCIALDGNGNSGVPQEAVDGGSAPRAVCCSAACRDASEKLFQILGPCETALRRFHRQERKRVSDAVSGDASVASHPKSLAPTTLPISVESVARCVATIGARLCTIVEQQGLTADVLTSDPNITHQVFAAATKSFNRLIEPPADSTFNDINVADWVAVLQRELRGPLFALLSERLRKVSASSAIGEGEETSLAAIKNAATLFVDAVLSLETINTLIGQLSLNAQALNTLVVVPGRGPCVACFGAAVFTLQSNLNHSCEPNAMVSATSAMNHEITVTTTQPIAEGEEVTISYIPVDDASCADERRSQLLPYFFECKCPRCARELAGASPAS